ncbi:MAG: hypothetical protein DRN49_06425 [Thaumarchaeota archaeon]|nr:MAG: hypothetical protein DRN49_06425 [Nitrososphaerota archaeon]
MARRRRAKTRRDVIGFYKDEKKRTRPITKPKGRRRTKTRTICAAKTRKVKLQSKRTRRWGVVKYPRGTKPLVAEVEIEGRKFVFKEGLGYKKPEEIQQLLEALIQKVKLEVQRDKLFKITIHFPGTRRKPVSVEVQGGQPLRPRIIHHPGWPPPPELIEDIKAEWEKPRNKRRKTATDLEALAYLNTFSMATPLNMEGYAIYCHLTYKYLKKKGWKDSDIKKTMPWLLEHKRLSDVEKRELEKLKDWIYKQQMKDLKQREKRAREIERMLESASPAQP